MSGRKGEGNGSTDRGKVCRVGQNHNPVVILRDKLGSPAWLRKPPPCSWLFSLLLSPLSLGSEVVPLLPGKRAEGKSESGQFCFWSSDRPEGELLDGLCLLCKCG